MNFNGPGSIDQKYCSVAVNRGFTQEICKYAYYRSIAVITYFCYFTTIKTIKKKTFLVIHNSNATIHHTFGYVNKQICRIWATENSHAYSKTSNCLVWILVQRHNWTIFFFFSKISKDRPLE